MRGGGGARHRDAPRQGASYELTFLLRDVHHDVGGGRDEDDDGRASARRVANATTTSKTTSAAFSENTKWCRRRFHVVAALCFWAFFFLVVCPVLWMRHGFGLSAAWSGAPAHWRSAGFYTGYTEYSPLLNRFSTVYRGGGAYRDSPWPYFFVAMAAPLFSAVYHTAAAAAWWLSRATRRDARRMRSGARAALYGGVCLSLFVWLPMVSSAMAVSLAPLAFIATAARACVYAFQFMVERRYDNHISKCTPPNVGGGEYDDGDASAEDLDGVFLHTSYAGKIPAALMVASAAVFVCNFAFRIDYADASSGWVALVFLLLCDVARFAACAYFFYPVGNHPRSGAAAGDSSCNRASDIATSYHAWCGSVNAAECLGAAMLVLAPAS